MKTKIPTQAEYEQRELQRHFAYQAELPSLPMAERKENAARMAKTIREEPETFATRLEWLIEGCYGKGSQMAAERILSASKRTNKNAALFYLLADYEYRTGQYFATKTWHGLTEAQQATVNDLFSKIIKGEG
jgi:hypothetical protein